MMTTTSIGGLYAGRLVIGLANGMFMTFAQLYLQVCLTDLPMDQSSLTLDRNVHLQDTVVSQLEHFKAGHLLES